MKTPRKPTPKLRADVFVKAAEIVDSNDNHLEFCCNALDEVGTDSLHPAKLYFIDVLRPRSAHEAGQHEDAAMWAMNSWYGYSVNHSPSNRHARILGLLLCAELVRDGFEPTPYKRD